MLTAPYPTPRLASYALAAVVAWSAMLAAGIWVLFYPPVTYRGIGEVLTSTWGWLLVLGSALALVGNIFERYRFELAGLPFAMGAVAIYAYLSWESVVTGTTGAGPRALLLVALFALLVMRLRVLLHIDSRLDRIAKIAEGVSP